MSIRRSRRKSLLSVDVRDFDCDDITPEDDISSSARTDGMLYSRMTEKDDLSVAGVRMLESVTSLSCHQPSSFNRSPWTVEEDERLFGWVQCNGATHWTLASQQFQFRTPMECMERWKMLVNKEQKKKCPWTDKEDHLLLQLYQANGNQWQEYAKHLPERTEQEIKNRWSSIVKSRKPFCSRPATPLLSSDSFYHRTEPVKLFSTPNTPPRYCINEEHVGCGPSATKCESKTPPETSTPLSLGISSLLSPDDLLLSPATLWTPEETIGTHETDAFLSELEALLQSSDFNLRLLDTPPNVTCFTALRSKSLDDPCDQSVNNSGRNVTEKLIHRQTMVRRLKFETPCILRKRKRCSPRATRTVQTERLEKKINVQYDGSEYKVSRLMTSDSPRNEAPFTPSRFLNSPQVVTSTPVAKTDRLTPPAPLNSILCSPPAKQLLVNEFPQTPTPFKQREHSLIDILMPEEVEDVDVDGGISFLPFSAYSGLDNVTERDPVMKIESANKDVAGCQLTLTKSLDKPWPASATGNPFVESLISLETPSKSLVNDESLMFSPPSIIRDTLHESLFDQTTPSSRLGHLPKATEPSTSRTNFGWERVACGQTLTQMELVKQAKELLDDSKLHIRPRSLQL